MTIRSLRGRRRGSGDDIGFKRPPGVCPVHNAEISGRAAEMDNAVDFPYFIPRHLTYGRGDTWGTHRKAMPAGGGMRSESLHCRQYAWKHKESIEKGYGISGCRPSKKSHDQKGASRLRIETPKPPDQRCKKKRINAKRIRRRILEQKAWNFQPQGEGLRRWEQNKSIPCRANRTQRYRGTDHHGQPQDALQELLCGHTLV